MFKIINKDLSYCEDIKIIEENFSIDNENNYLKEEHPAIFGLCQISERSPKSLINSANYLAGLGYCSYSQLFYNEASKSGTLDELDNYDKSICK